MTTQRLLAVDLGTKRIGLAVNAPGTEIVSPVEIIAAQPDERANAEAIVAAAREYDADGIVLGLPLNMDGTEGPQAKLSRKLVEAIKSAGGPPVYLHDERLTSDAADRRLIDRELTRKKKKARQDAIAAQILLESYLATHGDE